MKKNNFKKNILKWNRKSVYPPLGYLFFNIEMNNSLTLR